MRITSRNARFQQWLALLTNRTKRAQLGEFVVQGVRPITLAVERGWAIRELLYDGDRPRLSEWATRLLHTELGRTQGAQQLALSTELMAELGEKAEAAPELLAIVAIPDDELARIPVDDRPIVVLDRPASPGNLGTAIRSADALGAAGLVVSGHAADPYDPKAVRSSTGSLLALPVVRAASHRPVAEWAAANGLRIFGADEAGADDLDRVDLTGPALLVIGTEATGLSSGWRQACDQLIRIPMAGAASSLNAATAASIILYETRRQRRMHVQ